MVKFSGKSLGVVIGLLVLSLSLSSCDTLRQKFIRHKKQTDEDQGFQPVLVPEEYSNPAQNPVENYKEQYGLIKAWYKDLWTAIDERNSPKYIDYILEQVSNHIAEMEKLVDAPTQANLLHLDSYLDYYKQSLDYPWQMRNVSRIQSDLRAFDRFLRDHLRDDKLKGHFVQPPSQ